MAGCSVEHPRGSLVLSLDLSLLSPSDPEPLNSDEDRALFVLKPHRWRKEWNLCNTMNL